MTRSALLFGIACAMLFLQACSKESGDYNRDLIPVLQNGKAGYVDTKGAFVIAPQFEAASVFSNGLARVRDKGKYGFIDDKGKPVIPPTYKYASIFSEGMAVVVRENNPPEYINAKGEVLFAVKNAQRAGVFSEGLAPVQIKAKWGFVDAKGELAIPAQYRGAMFFSDGMAPIIDERRKWGFIDKTGKTVIAPAFDAVGNFRDGLCSAFDGKNYGFIDKTGAFVIPARYQHAFDFTEGYGRVRLDNKYGFIDTKGGVKVAPQYDVLSGMYGGLASFKTGDSTGFIDADGMVVIPRQFQVATPFIGDVALVMKDKKIGLIDRKGAFVVQPTFDGFDMSYMLTLEGALRGFLDYSVIPTDLFNPDDLAEILVRDCSGEKFHGLDAASTYTDITKIASVLPQPVAGVSTLEAMEDVPLTPEARQARSVYTFTDSPLTSPGATLTGLQLDIRLLGPAIGKQSQVVDALKKAFVKLGLAMSEEGPDRATFTGPKVRIVAEGTPKRLMISVTFLR